ncbi:Coiled-coil domain-containing protein 19, mitochondrial [Trachymyrmex zeteki]|uniref:Cilia- and flagella-associated protein 45 n=1 Tax=Mycetomoellerius zeteki TaxID=64791 RepID=A0A151XAC7_9HYME|nr:PREDICTED: cilia- and flagella-associated protein 45-like [Trachymyrmex zeteki]KYQ57321.1 Coiled-coil domain-containing protein 19, mitochondrial [Trachymyrmex zeteki]
MSTKTVVRRTKSSNLEYRGDSRFPSGVYTIHLPSTCDRTLGNRPIHLKRSSAYEGKEIGKIRDKSGTRKYLIPSKEPMVYPKIMTKKEYEDLKERSRMITKEERQTAAETVEKERERLMKESLARKEAIRIMDMKKGREKDPRTREIEEEARRRTMHILERAHNMRLEQEEEIQKCNRLILETKCRAIRDAQIAEKKLMEQELLEEEKRLNDMMEEERRWAIKEESRKEQEEEAKRLRFAKILKEQIIENEEQRILQFERKQEESRLINLNNIAWQQDEIEKLRNKEAENAKVRQELAEGNEQLKHFKAMEEEENRIIDLRIQNYHRLKEEREAKKSEERLKKEREKTRVAMRTVQAHELQAQIDEINAARVQEEVEREWRQKEKEEALKKLEAQKILQKQREEQINNKRIMQAIEIERERQEFERIVRVQKAAFCREKKELEQKQQQALIHRSEILKQVNEKERERIVERQKMFKEGLAIRAETAMRKKKLQDAMERKCQEMRENKVPDIYINEVKRMIETIQ